MTVNATAETRKQFTGDSNNTTSTDFTANFNYLSTSEIQVVHTDTTTATDTNYVEGTHYSVQSGASAASVTIRFLTGYVPTADTEYVTISRNMTLSQDTDYTEGSTLDAETLEQNFDKAIMISQQIKNNVTDLNLSFSETNDFHTTAAAASEIKTSKANRINKILSFDSNGDILATQEIGTFRGDWVTGATYQLRDLVKQASASDSLTQNNIYICTTAHSPSTGSYLTQNDTSNWTLILDVATAVASADTATTQATKAGRHEDNAEAYAQTTAETLVTYTNPTSGATSNDGYSSLHYREKAKEWAGTGTGYALVTDDTGANTTEYSAKAWAAKPSGTVDGATASAKVSAANAATSESNASNSETNAAASATAAAASAAAVANALDSFDDKYLGVMEDNASATSATANGTWAINSSSITLASISGTVEVGQEVTGSGIPTDANVLTWDSGTSTAVISENMAAAGSGVALTFTGQGVYGAWDAAKDGPSTDNDGNALVNGALYFNSTDGEMRVYDTNSGVWIAASAAQNATVEDYTYTLSGSDSTISGADDNSATLSFSSQESVDVFLNGVKLVPKIGATANDYHLDTANTVTLTSTAVSGDVILVRVYKTFTVGDAVPASTGGTFSGNVAVNGDLTVDTDTLKVDSANNRVGIGTSSGPAKLLEVSGTESTLRLTDTDTSVSNGEYISGIEFFQNDSAGAGIGASIKAHGQGSTGLTQLRFATGATTNAETVAMVIDKDGNIGIGEDDPDAKLHVSGPTNSSNNTDARSAIFRDPGTNQGSLEIRHGYSTTVPDNRYTSLQAWSNEYGNPVPLKLNPNGGDVNIGNGNLVIGTSGKGIDFSNATDHTTGESSVGSVLDDYEEGTWTPTFNNSGSATVTYAKYRKVGNMVTVWARLIDINCSSYDSTSFLVGTPVATLTNEEYAGGSFMGYGVNLSGIITMSPYAYNNNFYFYYTVDNAGGWNDLNWGHFNTGGSSAIIFCATYPCQ